MIAPKYFKVVDIRKGGLYFEEAIAAKRIIKRGATVANWMGNAPKKSLWVELKNYEGHVIFDSGFIISLGKQLEAMHK